MVAPDTRQPSMPDRRPTGAAETVQRQLRQVRRRQNLYQLQRTLFLLLAALAAAATTLLSCALWTAASTFAIALGAIAALLAAVIASLLAGLRRRWLALAETAVWIEHHGGLAGRLRTLAELADRGNDGASALFLPLLLEENLRRLTLWTPARLVPRRLPRMPLAAAVGSVGSLLIALLLGRTLCLDARAPVAGERAIDTARGAGAAREAPNELVLAQAEPQNPTPGMSGNTHAPTAGEPAPPALARLPEEVQERVRRALWGEGSRTREPRVTSGSPARPEAGEGGGTWALADLAAQGTRSEDSAGTGSGAAATSPQTGGGRNEPRARSGPEASGGAGTAGAGNDSDPDLFGRASENDVRGSASFEVALGARLRTLPGETGARTGEAPPLAPDSRPVLAARQRGAAAGHRMLVPPGYEDIVRTVFAHRPRDDGGQP